MNIKFITYVVVLTAGLLAGCSTVAPKYSGSRQNIENLKAIGDFRVGVEKFSDNLNSGNKNPLTMRGINTVTSPYGGSYAGYVEHAVRQELSIADRYLSNSSIKIGGKLFTNDVDASGFNIGTAVCEVEFTLQDGENTIYKKRFSENHQWESSFAAAIAIPKAINEYPVMIQKLINKLFTDTEFLEKLRAATNRR